MGPSVIIWLALASIGWLAGWAILGRSRFCHARREPSKCRFTVIIPARNEEENLPSLLGSLRDQPIQPDQVIVVDDQSTDRTADIAREFGAIVLTSAPLPDGWRGKTWACHQGASMAATDHLLFLDADTRLQPLGLQAILDSYDNGNAGPLSVCPFHEVPRLYEQLSAIFNLVMIAGIGSSTLWRQSPDGLFGQMLMIRRDTYQQVGGHQRVKEKVLENLWLARHLKSAGTPIRCLLGRGVLSFRMYPGGIESLIEGWTKGFASGASATAPAILLLVIIWLTGAMTVIFPLALRPSTLSAIAYAAFVLQIGWLLRCIGSFRWVTALLYPIPLIFFFTIFGRSVFRSHRTVTWKGRTIHAD